MGYDELNDKTDENIYDDDMAVAAVGGLFGGEKKDGGSEGTASDIVDVRDEAASPRRVPVREYKVREYFSEQDDLSAEDEPAKGESATEPVSGEPLPASKKDSFNPENEDYSEYIKAMSRENAEEKNKKVVMPREKEMVRDASRNPAVRREQKTDGKPEKRTDTGDRRDDRRVEIKDDKTDESRAKAPPKDSRADTGRTRARNMAYPDGRVREAEAVSEKTGEPIKPAPPRAVPKYPVSSTGRIPVKGNVRGSKFFEAENRADDGGDAVSMIMDLRVIMVVVSIILFALSAFLFLQNMSLRGETRDVDEALANLAAAEAEITDLKLNIANLQDDLKTAEGDLAYYQGLAQNSGNDITDPGDGDNGGHVGLGLPGNPMPTPMAPMGPIEYTVVSGDTLTRIANQFYGDGTRWREIYNFNHLTTEQLRIGQSLLIPR
ncbi:MAG: LysM peptidoglycan-binding domain-containing protein [Defluviitaleaceae bacterium]|nr:LysM peptidoglycan-binding domain-containing protein [Defluviitaleaceae bacterium]MCL2835996.1 LysM peptidoglycan-binding domain-containing protein [Defluviitaleaceae bacterium]